MSMEKKQDIKSALLAGLMFAVLFGALIAILLDWRVAVIFGTVSGALFGGGMLLFLRSGWVKAQTEVQHMDGKVLLHAGKANHLLNREMVGGKLYLFEDKLHFKSHAFNLQSHSMEWPLGSIYTVELFNMAGFIPTGLLVTTHAGTREKFVVNGRKFWKQKIEEAIK